MQNSDLDDLKSQFSEGRLGRRAFIGAVAALVGCRAASPLGPAGPGEETWNFPDLDVGPGTPSLSSRAGKKNLWYGTSLTRASLNDREFARSVAQQCDMIVPEGALKWMWVHPQHSTYDFSIAHRMLKFARTFGMKFRGHTLVWHQSLPPWLYGYLTSASRAVPVLQSHIREVAGYFAGSVYAWDVVNEALAPEDGLPNGFRHSPWYYAMGESYVDIAFRAAAEADPGALLAYNDFGIESDTPRSVLKRTAVLNLLDRLIARGVPIHALGVQCHLDTAEPFHDRRLAVFLDEVRQRGLAIVITELDVRDTAGTGDPSVRDRAVAAAYDQYMNVFLDCPAVQGIGTWGLSDRYSWLGPQARGLPLDVDYRPKECWEVLGRAIDACSPKQPVRRM